MHWLKRVIVLVVLLAPFNARAAGLSPAESLKHFTPAEGLEVTLVAAEPRSASR